jgi:hypothetical protein
LAVLALVITGAVTVMGDAGLSGTIRIVQPLVAEPVAA